MSGTLSFHRHAAARGDGLHPRLRELLEKREQPSALGSTVFDLAAERGNPLQAGPFPTTASPQFLTGDVVRFRRKTCPSAVAPQKSATSSAK